MHADVASSTPQRSTAASSPVGLDELLDLDAPALLRLYKGARVPRLTDVAGDLRGRMLAVPSLSGRAADAVRAFARSDRFPWRGKSFRPFDDTRGEGINRVVVDRFRLYPFQTFIGPSKAGDFDAVQLDYDLPANPFFIRAIRDEIRELSPGLYLGQAHVRIGGAYRLWLYFGLERR